MPLLLYNDFCGNFEHLQKLKRIELSSKCELATTVQGLFLILIKLLSSCFGHVKLKKS